MSSSVFWLAQQLNGKIRYKILDKNRLEFNLDDTVTIVYCPITEEYEITSAVVRKAKDLDSTIIAYPHQWCKTTSSAISLGKSLGVKIMPFGAFLSQYG